MFTDTFTTIMKQRELENMIQQKALYFNRVTDTEQQILLQRIQARGQSQLKL